MAKRVAIIGAGASGITAIKCCVDEGLAPVCLEKTADIGGLWNFRKDADDWVACVMQSTVINTSKEMTSYSDFPFSEKCPNYMHHTHVIKYFKEYVDNFNLHKYIRFNSEVGKISQTGDFDVSGRWNITVRDRKSNTTTTEIFDAVILCTGHHAKPYIPKFEGEEEFRGERLHTHFYRDYPTKYAGRRVVVIGVGDSGVDAAVELSRIASQVYVSTRRGAWIMNRVADNGYPLDLQTTRFSTALHERFPTLMRTLTERRLNSRFDHNLYGIKPRHHVDQQYPTLSDDFPNRILCGSIQIRPNIERITETGVIFNDGTVEENIDTIFYATGYVFSFPFLDESVIDVKENRVNLYKYIFPPYLKHPTLAVLGCIQPLGATMPISEMQARWATRVFKGDLHLPSSEDMLKDMNEKFKDTARRYYESQRHTILVNYVQYMDELAEQIGCQPHIRKHILSDPKFGLQLIFGPCTPYQYRLDGYGQWAGAKNAIQTLYDRVKKPLQSRKMPPDSQQPGFKMLRAIILFVLLPSILYLMFQCVF